MEALAPHRGFGRPTMTHLCSIPSPLLHPLAPHHSPAIARLLAVHNQFVKLTSSMTMAVMGNTKLILLILISMISFEVKRRA